MKIAITGHTAGIGQAFTKILEPRGHEIVGISRRTGDNIRRIEHTATLIEPCDMFINNAQVGFAQTELFWEVWNRWRGQEKTIINISTQMTNNSVAPREEWDQYIIQKKALELAHIQCQERSPLPKLILVKPGSIATQPSQRPPEYQDVDEYAQETIEYINGQ